jgi:citrate synthase
VSGKRGRLRSDIAYSTADRIVVRGHELTDLIGTVSLGDFAFLELKGRLPTQAESAVFNAITVTLVEHGMTPSAIASRLTYLGAPESLQGAVAAGLLGLGSRYGGTVEDAARMLQNGLQDGGEGADLRLVARELVRRYRSERRPIPGIGHPIHSGGDPRTPKLFEIAAQEGFRGRHVELMQLVADEAAAAVGRPLPVNATGAIAAIASELELAWQVCRGLAVMARAIGLVAHLQEEQGEPLATEIWTRVEDEASAHLREPDQGSTAGPDRA